MFYYKQPSKNRFVSANGDGIVLELVLKPKGRCIGVQNFLLHLKYIIVTICTSELNYCVYHTYTTSLFSADVLCFILQ